MVEGSAATSLRAAGWSAETISAGDYVRINGRAGRNDRPMISMGSVEILDPGTKAVLANLPVRRQRAHCFREGRIPIAVLDPAVADEHERALPAVLRRRHGRKPQPQLIARVHNDIAVIDAFQQLADVAEAGMESDEVLPARRRAG